MHVDWGWKFWLIQLPLIVMIGWALESAFKRYWKEFISAVRERNEGAK